eukprot:CAMPEP_0206431206 /NCGR_PEP_ID=MMETSP0324_2-20121206/7236_1 /ASSEMBLY_ACC=CAM_ASM_000836 /TAXON_ID=2866 /ORGANISM="Crypthecodinium cohnii, Strain Seligo" /LENGTH=137 /DNA_ID=CAMNT_0053897109 /DNA_START=719 /DNA_END=1133 /DNA_ORIENTATION=-
MMVLKARMEAGQQLLPVLGKVLAKCSAGHICSEALQEGQIDDDLQMLAANRFAADGEASETSSNPELARWLGPAEHAADAALQLAPECPALGAPSLSNNSELWEPKTSPAEMANFSAAAKLEESSQRRLSRFFKSCE